MAEPGLAERVVGGIGAADASIALLIVNDDCRVADASLAGCRLLGLARDEILGRPLGDLLAAPAANRFRGVWSVYHETGGHAGPFELAGPGNAAPIDISVTPAVLPGRHLVVLSATAVAGRSRPAGDPGQGGRAGSRGPTAREREILSMLADGGTDLQIAAKLDLSPATVQTHVRNAKAKLGARTRAQAVAMAMRRGMIVAA